MFCFRPSRPLPGSEPGQHPGRLCRRREQLSVSQLSPRPGPRVPSMLAGRSGTAAAASRGMLPTDGFSSSSEVSAGPRGQHGGVRRASHADPPVFGDRLPVKRCGGLWLIRSAGQLSLSNTDGCGTGVSQAQRTAPIRTAGGRVVYGLRSNCLNAAPRAASPLATVTRCVCRSCSQPALP